ncbi:hypothetical protein AGMMS49574_04600 [Bacteroidia bacterium]|nr:hypothetical protein AGMMS49574_04600 [Bacteroidia bacterium]
MKTKKLFVFSLACVLLSSCASYKLDKTIWYNLSPAEKDGEKGIVVTSLYFLSADAVDIYNSVLVDTVLVVQPYKYATGTYSTTGNPKKEVKISVSAATLQKENVNLKGIFYKKDDAMFLVSQDSISKTYVKLPNTKLP